ncbi:UDP-3-O-acyl-N-acetylglucosamine deacetylase [Aliihoeflea sp. PC F10.4]
MATFQTTLANETTIAGVGVHGGKEARLLLRPADANTGIVFVDAKSGQRLAARRENVASTELSTVLGDPAGFHVGTVEHLMSALCGVGLDNIEIEIAGNEIPILDGSAAGFVAAIDAAGIARQDAEKARIRVLRPVRIENGSAWAEFVPHEGSRFEVAIEFPSAAIGRQEIAFDLDAETYRSEIAPARTFGFMRDVERLWAAGLALGSSLENSVVIGEDDSVVNADGLRFSNEFVRHKALDAVGDLAIGGSAIIGLYRSFKAGHRMNAAALDALLSSPDAFELL